MIQTSSNIENNEKANNIDIYNIIDNMDNIDILCNSKIFNFF